MSRRKSRKAAPRERVSPEILTEAIGQGNFAPEPAEIAGQFVAVKREGAHRRLAREKRISGEAENAVAKYIEDFEAAEGAQQGDGAGGKDACIVTARMIAAERVRHADERMGSGGRHLLVAACVFTIKPEEIARRMLGLKMPDASDVLAKYFRSPAGAHVDLDRLMDAYRARAVRLLDKCLIPVIERLAAERQPANQSVDKPVGNGQETGTLHELAHEATTAESP